jgi:hypothetical protein
LLGRSETVENKGHQAHATKIRTDFGRRNGSSLSPGQSAALENIASIG